MAHSRIRKSLLCGLLALSLTNPSTNGLHSLTYGQTSTLETTKGSEDTTPDSSDNQTEEANSTTQETNSTTQETNSTTQTTSSSTIVERTVQFIKQNVAEVEDYSEGTPTPSTPLIYYFPDIHATGFQYNHTRSMDHLREHLGLHLIGIEGFQNPHITSNDLTSMLDSVLSLQAQGKTFQFSKNEKWRSGKKARPIQTIEDLLNADPLLRYSLTDDATLFGLENPKTNEVHRVIEKIQKKYIQYFNSVHEIKDDKEPEKNDSSNSSPIGSLKSREKLEDTLTDLISNLPNQTTLPQLEMEEIESYLSHGEIKTQQEFERVLRNLGGNQSYIKGTLKNTESTYAFFWRFPEEIPKDLSLPDFKEGIERTKTVYDTPFYRAIHALEERYTHDIRTRDILPIAISQTRHFQELQVAIVYGRAHKDHLTQEMERARCPFIILGKPKGR